MRVWILLLVLLSGPAPTATAQTDIWAAAREGDVERVRELLAAGVDVNAKTRYNVTPLYFAASYGHVELIDLLVEKGATLNDRDDFSRSTPLDAAIGGEHAAAAVRLIEHGADTTYSALEASVRGGLPSVTAAIVARGPVLDFEKSAALAWAQKSDDPDLSALVEEAKVLTELPKVELDAAALESLAGLYRNRVGTVLEIRVAEGALTARTGDDEPRRLVALSPLHLRSPADHDRGVYFWGRLGIIEGLRVVHGIEGVPFRRFETDETKPVSAAPPEKAEVVAAPRRAPLNWPSFRGPDASGVGDGQGVPVTWDVETGANVLWRTAVPGLAHSSPVVWGDRVFLTTVVSTAGEPKAAEKMGSFATFEDDDKAPHTWKTLALDKATGELLWLHDAGTAVPLTGRHPSSSQANSTPATDGRHVVVVFPTAGMICYDVDGRVLWRKDLGGLNAGNYVDASIHWGFAASPLLDDGKVILQADVHEGAFLAAYDVRTGRQLWKTPRDEVSGWATPTIFRHGEHPEIVTNGPTIRGYDLKTGAELWTLRPNSEQVMPTPVTAHGLIYVTTGYPPAFPIYAVRPGHRGDLSLQDGATSSEAIAWSHPRGGSYMVTPLVYGDIFYLPANAGRLAAYDALTGERIYRARLTRGGNFTASPVAADGLLYLPTNDGLVYVIRSGRQYEEVATNDMKESVTASPAISDGALFVRTRTRLYALGSKDAPTP